MPDPPSIRISLPTSQAYSSPPRLSASLASTSDPTATITSTTTPTPTSTSTPTPSASPMAIGLACDPIPPPLPPPTILPELVPGQDPGWQWGNDLNLLEFGRSTATSAEAGSSPLGGGGPSSSRLAEHKKEQEIRRGRSASQGTGSGSSLSTVTAGPPPHERSGEDTIMGDDEGLRSRPVSSYGLQSEKQLEQRTLEKSSQTYDKQLLNSLGGPNTQKRLSVSGSNPEAPPGGLAAPKDFERRNSLLKPLAVPDVTRRPSTDSSPSSARTPLGGLSPGALSPGGPAFWAESDPAENGHPATMRRGSFFSDRPPSHRGSYDHNMFNSDEGGFEENQMVHLHLHDRSPSSPKAGSKRRASSPSRGEIEDHSSVSSASGHSEIYHRRSFRQLSPGPRHQHGHSSISSASSHAAGRHGSLGSSLGIGSVPSSATSYGSGRVSPCALSPAIDPELRNPPVYGDGKSLHPTPVSPQHQRAFSDHVPCTARKLSTDSSPRSRGASLSQIHGMYICECCPKKPKKFETAEDLRLHESEKQYICAYCPNRFKNKNEAERHQNSLHLRRHSWSCAALTGIEAAFHPSPTNPATDICGYCGAEFPAFPSPSPSSTTFQHPHPHHQHLWDARADHLNHVHKYGECNQAKKFFRADHFRQHLKHSHHGAAGKWTNVLESACMKDEPAPEKREVGFVGAGGGRAGTSLTPSLGPLLAPPLAPTSLPPPPALMVTTTGLGGGPHEVPVPVPGECQVLGPLITQTPADD